MTASTIRVEFAPTLMTRDIAAYYISCSVRELDRLRETKVITPVGEGRKVKYRKADLDAYAETVVERPASRGGAS